jgi:hypothetical protein
MNLTLSLLGIAILFMLIASPLGWITGQIIKKIVTITTRRYWSHQNTVIAEYAEPYGLRPSEIAFLYDRSFDENDLLATIFDFELRGAVSLQPYKEGTARDFLIRANKYNVDALKEYEQEVYFAIKSYPEVMWSKLKASTQIWDSSIEIKLENDLEQQGYFWTKTSYSYVSRFWVIGCVISGAVIILPGLWSDSWLQNTASLPNADFNNLEIQFRWLTFGVLWIVATIVLSLCFYFFFESYTKAFDLERGTQRLYAIWPKLEGFREYLRVVEQDRIKFDNETLRENAREQTLPYATALNLSTRWEKRFH